MATNAGQLVRLQVNGVDYDPMGDFTIKVSRIKREHIESTRRGNHYFREMAEPGSISGAVSIREDQDTEPLTTAQDAAVLAETPSGLVYRGVMTYTADAENAINDGQLQLELMGELTEL
jgi:hypothetical protein